MGEALARGRSAARAGEAGEAGGLSGLCAAPTGTGQGTVRGGHGPRRRGEARRGVQHSMEAPERPFHLLTGPAAAQYTGGGW